MRRFHNRKRVPWRWWRPAEIRLFVVPDPDPGSTADNGNAVVIDLRSKVGAIEQPLPSA